MIKKYCGLKTMFALIIGMSGISLNVAADAQNKVYTIDDIYKAAIQNNEYIKIAEEDKNQSQDRINQALSYLLPHFVSQSEYTAYDKKLPSSGDILFQPDSQFMTSLVMTQPLYAGGRTAAAFRAAKKYREGSLKRFSLAKQDLVMNVAAVYYGVIKAEKLIEINTRSLEALERHQNVTDREASTRKTKANQSALLRANTLVSEAKIALVRSQDGLTIAREKLSLITKLPQDIKISDPPKLPEPNKSLDELQKFAFDTRDDFLNAKIDKNIAEESVKIIRGSHYPQLNAEAGMWYSHSWPALLTDATVFYGGLRLQIPIFEGGLMTAEIAEAKSKVIQAELATDFLRESINSDVQEASVNIKTLNSVIDTAKLQIDYANRNFDLVEGLFSEGLLSSLSLIDAEQARTLAEMELMNATYDRELAILKLKKAMGTLGKEY